MADWRDWLAFPFRAATAGVRIAGRITIGSIGFVLMGGGLLLCEPLGILYIGSGDGGSGLAMGTADGKRSIGFTRLVEGVPPTGTYTLGDDTESNTTRFIGGFRVQY